MKPGTPSTTWKQRPTQGCMRCHRVFRRRANRMRPCDACGGPVRDGAHFKRKRKCNRNAPRHGEPGVWTPERIAAVLAEHRAEVMR